jgi:hypothetical protein
MKKFHLIVLILLISISISPALCWSNGGYSTDPSSPVYGTHDWIAEKALNLLPYHESSFIHDNLSSYLLGTEYPDNPSFIGDTTKHHIYFDLTGDLTDDSSAVRAQTEYDIAVNFYLNNDISSTSLHLGMVTHYISDMAVFGHVMGTLTPWGTEEHHSDYETYINNNLHLFEPYITPLGLTNITAYDASITLAYDTTFGKDNQFNCTWMDTNYDFNNTQFINRCGSSLNLAVNKVASVLHTFYIQNSNSPSPSPTSTPTPVPTNTPSPTVPITSLPTPIPEPEGLNYGKLIPLLILGTIILFAFIIIATQSTEYTNI